MAEPPPAEPKPVVKRTVAPRPQKDPLENDAPPPAAARRRAPAPKAASPAPKPVIKKPTKAWVDPFAN